MRLLPWLALAPIALSACATVNYLPRDSSAKYAPSSRCEILWTSPDRPFTEIGMVTAESDDYGEEKLLEKLRAKAMHAGADAVVMMGGPSVRSGGVVTGFGSGFGAGNTATFSGFGVTEEVRRLQGLAVRYR